MTLGTRWRRASNANLTVDATSPVPSLLSPSPRTPTAPSPRTPTSATMPRTPTSSQPRPSMSRTESSRSSNSGEGSVYRGAAYAASTPRLSSSTGRSTWELVDASSLAPPMPDRHMQSIRTTRNFIFPLSEEHGPVSGGADVEGASGHLGFTGFIGAYEDEPVVVVELRIDSRKTVPIARTTVSKTKSEMVSTLDMVRYHGLLPEGTTVRQTQRRLEPERPERRSMRRKSSVPQLPTERVPIPPPVAPAESSPALSSAATLSSAGSVASPLTPSVVFVPSPPSPALSQFPADDIAFPLPPTSLPTAARFEPREQRFRRTLSTCSTTLSACSTALSSCSTTSSADMPTFGSEDHTPLYPRPPPRRERRAPTSAPGSSVGHGSHASCMSMASVGSLGHSDELEVESKRLSESSAEPTTPTTPTTPTSAWTQARLQRSPSQRAPIFKRSMSFRPPAPASPGAAFTALPAPPLGEAPPITPKSERRVSLAKARRRESALLGTPIQGPGLYEANPSLTDIIAADHEEAHAL